MSGGPRQKLFLMVALVLLGVAATTGSAQGSGAIDVRGTYEGFACVGGTLTECEAHATYPSRFTITAENFETGVVSGTGAAISGGDTWTVTGTISGSTLALRAFNFAHETYESNSKLTASPDGGKLQGTFSDSYGRVNQPTFATRISKTETPEEGAAKKAKEEAEKAGMRPTGTSVICNYKFATSENTCVASVGDGGPQPPVTPTGTVSFTTTSGGFANGASCMLLPTPASPQVASCSLIYQTAYSGLPSITATYGGDSRHAGSVGHTQFLGTGSGDTTGEAPPGAPGQYPNEVTLETSVPTNGTTVEAVVQGPDTHPAPVPMVLPKIDPSLDPTSQTDLGFIDKVAVIVNGSGAEDPKTVKEMNEVIAKAYLHAEELLKSGNAAEQANGQVLIKDTNATLEAISKMLKQQAEAQKRVINNAKGSSFSSAHSAAKKRKTKSVKPLAYLVRRNVVAGKLKLGLRLNRAALSRLAGKRNSVTVYMRVDMLLPSKLLKGGLPRSVIERITLKRAPAAKAHRKH